MMCDSCGEVFTEQSGGRGSFFGPLRELTIHDRATERMREDVVELQGGSE